MKTKREYPRFFINIENDYDNRVWMEYAAVKEPGGKVKYFVKPEKQPANVDDLKATEDDAEFFVSRRVWMEISKYEIVLMIDPA